VVFVDVGNNMNIPANHRRAGKQRAFTRVEVLVVIGIIAVLIGILIPVVTRVQNSAKRTACASNLREIGNFFQMYLNENKMRVPRVNPLPSMQNLNNSPSIVRVFEPYVKNATNVYRCPVDRIINVENGPIAAGPNPVETYFEREGSSYEYNTFFNAFSTTDERTGVNKVWVDALADIGRHGRQPTDIDIFRDFDPFHDKPGSDYSRNYLFADFHVGPRPKGGTRIIRG